MGDHASQENDPAKYDLGGLWKWPDTILIPADTKEFQGKIAAATDGQMVNRHTQ